MNDAFKLAAHIDDNCCSFNESEVFADTMCMSRIAIACFKCTASIATTFTFRLKDLIARSLDSVAVMLNLLLQLERYDACCPLFKELCAFELKYKYEPQIFAAGISLLGLKKTAAVVQRLTHSQLMKMVLVWQKMTLKLVVEQEKASVLCVRANSI